MDAAGGASLLENGGFYLVRLRDLQDFLRARTEIPRHLEAVPVERSPPTREQGIARRMGKLHRRPRHGQQCEALRTDGEELPAFMVLHEQGMRIRAAVIADTVAEQARADEDQRRHPLRSPPNGCTRTPSFCASAQRSPVSPRRSPARRGMAAQARASSSAS